MAPGEQIIVRPSASDDFDAIARLWLPRKKDPEVMKWLHRDADGSYRSFVAETNGKVVGHIGYVVSDFAFKGQSYKGVFSIEWRVDENHKQAALPLYSKILKIGDFTYVIGGTRVVNEMYPLMKFKVPLHVHRFIKVVRPIHYLKASGYMPIKNLAKAAFYSRGLILNAFPEHETAVEVRPMRASHYKAPIDPNTAENIVTQGYHDWAISAPGVRALAFEITRKGRFIGKALCYIDQIGSALFGRITHVSYLGDAHALWRTVIAKLEASLKRSGCCMISVMACSNAFIGALESSGYIFVKKSPFWLRDRKGFFKDASWHLTYLEGDLGYRKLYV